MVIFGKMIKVLTIIKQLVKLKILNFNLVMMIMEEVVVATKREIFIIDKLMEL